MSGISSFCRARGKAFFGLLTASAHLKPELISLYGRQSTSRVFIPPYQVCSDDNGVEFGRFWTWLWEFHSLGYGVLNIDVWLYFLLRTLTDSHHKPADNM